VVNVVRDAVKQFSRPVHMIVGGFHLGAPELQVRIPPTVAFLAHAMHPAPTYVLPMHCSGFATKVALEKEFGQGCVPAGSGMRYEVQGDKELDDGLKVSIK
jgi:7,8-dihydropterin-6-yl-methyl-4-(beta-D-ribofuranosyl)aminobenzene 5'-phosphate synthase